jgi:transcriptional regulator with XRE-family HTH domain
VNSGSAFAEALQRHRRARGMTQAELAEHARVSERAISDLERGLKSPQRATVRLLIQALGLPADQAREFESLARRPSPATSDAATGTPVHRDTNVPIHLPSTGVTTCWSLPSRSCSVDSRYSPAASISRLQLQWVVRLRWMCSDA